MGVWIEMPLLSCTPRVQTGFAFLTGCFVLLKNRIFSMKIVHEGLDKVTKYVNSLSNATLAILCISLSLQLHAIHSYAASMISTRGICRDFACCSLAHLSKPPLEPARKTHTSMQCVTTSSESRKQKPIEKERHQFA